MLEILQFVFSSFWTWLGTVIILSVCKGFFINITNIVEKNKPKEFDINNKL